MTQFPLDTHNTNTTRRKWQTVQSRLSICAQRERRSSSADWLTVDSMSHTVAWLYCWTYSLSSSFYSSILFCFFTCRAACAHGCTVLRPRPWAPLPQTNRPPPFSVSLLVPIPFRKNISAHNNNLWEELCSLYHPVVVVVARTVEIPLREFGRGFEYYSKCCAFFSFWKIFAERYANYADWYIYRVWWPLLCHSIMIFCFVVSFPPTQNR